MVTRALEHVNGLQVQADDYARQAAVGELDSVSDYMIAATEAQLTTQLTVAVRNRAVEAFNDIMRMQV
jgi:flagellar hook-basal body complex protein FliE